MKKLLIGDVVRQVRECKGITQEELCKGICSISTLSRIENGWQQPTRSMFTLLVERMGEEGILYDDYVGDYDYEVYNLAMKIITSLDRKDISCADKYLDKLRFIVGDGQYLEEKEECVYRFVELLSSSVECNIADKYRDKEEVEIYQYGYHLYEEVDKLLGECLGNKERQGRDGMDAIEIRMYNLMGYAKFVQKDYKNAIDIWVRLIEEYRRRDDTYYDFPKERAALYCNVSAALSTIGMYDEAETFATKGIRICFDGGNLRLVNRLLHNRMYCLSQKGDNNKAYTDLAFAKAIYTSSKKDLLREEKIRKLPNTPYIIQII